MVATIWGEHGQTIVQLSYSVKRGFPESILNKRFKRWWRRRESNPRPKMSLVKSLHAYSRSCPGHYPRTFATPAQNGQETEATSLWFSSSQPRRSREDQPAVRRPPEAHGRSLLGRLPKLVRLRMPSVDWQLSFCPRLRVCAPRHASWPQASPSKP